MFTGSAGKMFGKGRSSVPQMPCTTALSSEERPSVTMMSEMTGSPIMGRRMSRSVRMPSSAEKTSVRTNDQKKGIWYCTDRVRQT